jgi:ABC-type Fe3+-siderophore transport system permease subunit
MLVALVAGSVCGALWMLLVDTVANTILTDTINESAVLLVGVVTALVAALFLSAPTSLECPGSY